MEYSINKQLSLFNFKIQDSEKQISKTTRNNDHLYFEQMKPLLILNWILARQPYERNRSGNFQLDFVSWRMAYCLAFYSIQLIISVMTGHEILSKMNTGTMMKVASENTPSYDVTLYTVLLLMFLFFEILNPILNWVVAKKFILFLNRWRKFQDLHLIVTGEDLKLGNCKSFIMMYVGSSVIISIVIDEFESHFLLAQLDWVFLLPFMLIALDILCLTGTWAFSCYFIGSAIDGIDKSFFKAKAEAPSARKISEHRILWLHLSELFAIFCSSQQGMILMLIFLVIVCLIISSYGLVTSLFDQRYFGTAAFTVPLLYAVFQLIIICEFGHRTSKKIGENFSNKLDWIDSSGFSNEEWQETIYEIASYLIILVQLQSSEKNRSTSF